MRAAVVLALALGASAAWAGDCPPPTPLSCKQLTALLPYRCAAGEIAALCPEHPMQQEPTTPCPLCPSTRCDGATAEDVTRAIQAYCHDPVIASVYVPRDHGVPIVSVGAGYVYGATLDFGAGYRFRHGWDLLASAVWSDQHSSSTSYSRGGTGWDPDDRNRSHDEGGGYAVPYTATYGGGSHWGGRLTLTVPLVTRKAHDNR